MTRGKLLVGWARGEITPPRKTFVQGQFHTRISDEVISPLMATALALEAGGEQAVILSCDLAAEEYKDDLLRELEGRCEGLDRGKITTSATHTHNAPSTRRGIYDEPADDPEFMNPDEYRLWLAGRLADIIERAWESRKGGAVARGFGYAVVGRCRRARYADGSALMYGDTNRPDFLGFESCEDHAVNMLFTRDEAGELTGMLVNLACPAQCDESKSAFGADFWHDVREAIVQRYGAGVHLLPQCAPAGDMSPHLMGDRTEECDLRGRLGADDKGIIARRIMAAVDDGLANASPARSEVEFAHEVRTFRLPRMMVTDEQYEMEKRIRRMNDQERRKMPFPFDKVWPFGLVADLVARYEQQDENPTHEIESHIIRLGDVGLATNPFELFVDYGMRIRARSRALQTFLVQLADGSHEAFYLPTARALAGGHYSAMIKSNWVGPDGGQVLVDETLGVINELFADEEYPITR